MNKALKAWQIDQVTKDRKTSLIYFANYLGISRSVVSMWMNGEREPSLDSLKTIAPNLAKLLGPYVYDELGLQRPEPEIITYHQIHDMMAPDEQKDLIRMVRDYAEKKGYPVEEQLSKFDPGNES